MPGFLLKAHTAICHVKVHFALTTGLMLDKRVQVSVCCFGIENFYEEDRKELRGTVMYKHTSVLMCMGVHRAIPRKPGVYRV